MKKIKFSGGKLGIILCGVLLGCAAYGQPSVSVGVSVTLPTVQIRTDSDFYEPLAPEGQWIVVGSYGRVWRPAHVARDWRPYCDGNWVWTDAGWYWVSDEPWAWATYHYGSWGYADQYGWYWVPQTQWAPAWVSWHQGGGYIGWTPRYPSGAKVASTRAYVMVKQGRFLDPIRPTTVIVNTTAIIKHTAPLANTRVVNNTRFNEGPTTAFVEKSGGRKIQAVPFQELRHQQEAAATRSPARPATGERKVQPPVQNNGGSREEKAATTHDTSPRQQPATQAPAAPGPKHHDPAAPGVSHQPAPAAPLIKPATGPDHHPSPGPNRPAPPKPEQHQQPPDQSPANGNRSPDQSEHDHGNNH